MPASGLPSWLRADPPTALRTGRAPLAEKQAILMPPNLVTRETVGQYEGGSTPR